MEALRCQLTQEDVDIGLRPRTLAKGRVDSGSGRTAGECPVGSGYGRALARRLVDPGHTHGKSPADAC
jgi:hypothetical protein